jgi:hypothetical protein
MSLLYTLGILDGDSGDFSEDKLFRNKIFRPTSSG